MTLKQLDHVLDGMYHDGETHVRAKDLRRVLAGFCADDQSQEPLLGESILTKKHLTPSEAMCKTMWKAGYHEGQANPGLSPEEFIAWERKREKEKRKPATESAPPPSPSPDATEKGGDRAREAADPLHIAARETCKALDRELVDAPRFERIWKIIERYGDELLEAAAVQALRCVDVDCACPVCQASIMAAKKMRSHKSSATKGVANG